MKPSEVTPDNLHVAVVEMSNVEKAAVHQVRADLKTATA